MNDTTTKSVDSATCDVSVIIPYRNGAASVAECLAGLIRQQTNRTFEVIVVDDGSESSDSASALAGLLEQRNITGWFKRDESHTPGKAPIDLADRTVPADVSVVAMGLLQRTEVNSPDPDILKGSSLILLRQAPLGPAAARNTGAVAASGTYLLFTDSDCIPDKGWIESLCSALDAGAAGVKGVYRTEQQNWVARLVQAEYEEKYVFMSRFETIDFIDTYSAGFRRDVFLGYGGYDERFYYPSVEDQEFSFRLSAGGERMVFCSDAVVCHRHADSLRRYAYKKARIAFYKALILRLHPERTKGDTHTPPSLMFQLPLVLILMAGLVLSGWHPVFLPVSLFAAVLFAATCRKTIQQASTSAPDLRIAVPVLMLIRALSLAVGLFAGIVRFHLGPLPVLQRSIVIDPVSNRC